MNSEWTPELDAIIRELIGQNGYSYDHVANHFVTHGLRDTSAGAVRSRARRIGATPGTLRPAAEPKLEHVDGSRMEPGVKQDRYQKLHLPTRPGDRIVVISDSQIPFHDAKSIEAVEHFLDDYQPNKLIWDGDMLDFWLLSRFDKNPARAHSVQDELDIGRRMQDRQANRHPSADKVWILGNHEDRLRRFLWENPAIASLRALDHQSLFSADDAFRVLGYGSQVQISNTIIEHGGPVRGKSGYSARALFEKRGTSVIMGHTHRLSQASHRNALGQHAMIENGCLCLLSPEYDHEPDWTQGFTYGYVNNGAVHWYAVPILSDGFRADGRFYRR